MKEAKKFDWGEFLAAFIGDVLHLLAMTWALMLAISRLYRSGVIDASMSFGDTLSLTIWLWFALTFVRSQIMRQH